MKNNQKKDMGPNYGLGGWLTVFQIVLIINIIVFIVKEVGYFTSSDYGFIAMLYFTFTDFFGLTYILGMVLIVISFVALRRRSMLAKWFFISSQIVFSVNSIMTIIFLGTSVEGFFYGLIGASLWISYLINSQRVKNTLRLPGREMTDYEQHIADVEASSLYNIEKAQREQQAVAEE